MEDRGFNDNDIEVGVARSRSYRRMREVYLKPGAKKVVFKQCSINGSLVH